MNINSKGLWPGTTDSETEETHRDFPYFAIFKV